MRQYECGFSGKEALTKLEWGIPVRCMVWDSDEYLYKVKERNDFTSSDRLRSFLSGFKDHAGLITYLVVYPWETAWEAYDQDKRSDST
jgi:hypothetical protein